MDRTRKDARPGPGEFVIAHWDGAVNKRQVCRFCRHHIDSHDAIALMVRRPEHKRFQRMGMKWMACRKCAKRKGTDQVMCYQHSDAVIQKAKRIGLIVKGE